MSVDLCEQIYSDSSEEAIKRRDFASQKRKELNSGDSEADRGVSFDNPESEGKSLDILSLALAWRVCQLSFTGRTDRPTSRMLLP